ncbi:MAG: 4,5-DOPA dioxygenase extradiol [Nevskiaceae bacterium]|nr:MAG: 4,5-DOPA dioxygenase extradiol [Nevskiaceae bacterium]TBR75156.1 MAG: 4,5-DOPA dioxygenase extradiol [Nevskiaceae bacterium]
MPVVFFGHGNPLNALHANAWTRGWTAVGQHLPQRPRAVLCVSAHWYVPGTALTAAQNPRTIHDFGGFPRELFDVQYPAPGAPDLVRRVGELLRPTRVGRDVEWGLDHGTWSVLRHVFPAADVPVVQLAIDATQPLAFHYELGRRLRPLRDEGVLVIGSGNVVHNLRAYVWDNQPAEPFDWALRFDARVRELVVQGDHAALVDYPALGPDAALAIPTPDHYLPLLYVLGASHAGEAVTFPVEGIEGGSMSMLSIQWG